MHPYRKRIGVGLAGTAAVLLMSKCGPIDNDRMFDPGTKPTTTSIVRCYEDDECWDCHADGNNICGVDLGRG